MPDNKDIAIRVSNVHKTFKLPHEKHTSLKHVFLNSFRKKSYETQEVLRGVDFDIKKGEFFGIVGRNGSGKSTLLKCIAGVYTPSRGHIKINGSLVPFIELGVGFNPELSGRDNVYLNGALLGFDRKQMANMYDEIVEFAELEPFMDQKLKNYSSGMQVRLAFSIAIRAEGDILVLDEVLAVGDTAFQQKCFDYFTELMRKKKTIVLVTHSMSTVERFCTRGMLIENGKIIDIGKSSKIAALYEDMFLQDENKGKDKNEKVTSGQSAFIDAQVRVLQASKVANAVSAGKNFTISINIKSKQAFTNANVGINIRDEQDRIVFSTDLRKSLGNLELKAGDTREIELSIENNYTNGKYSVDLHIVNEGGGPNKVLFRRRKIQSFHVMGNVDHIHSMFHPKFEVKLK